MTSARLAALVVDELVALGVREAVLCPGSRCAPLSYALHRADADGRLRLHVRIDERSAGFLALGLAAGSGTPVPIACTSGTAAANLHPAVLEASHRGLPLLALTADRPTSLVGTGANQTTDQTRLYGNAARWFAALSSTEVDDSAVRSAVDRTLGWATGALSRDPGPVQLNLAFGEPLVAAPEDVTSAGPHTSLPAMDVVGSVSGPPPLARTLVVAGGAPGPWTAYAALAAQRHGWPVVAETSAAFGEVALSHGSLLLDAPRWLDEHGPQRVVVVGNPTLHRGVQALLRRAEVEVVVVAATPRWPDAAHAAARVVAPGWLRAVADLPARPDPAFGDAWASAAGTVARVVAETVGWPSGYGVARAVFASLPSGAAIQLGSSNAVRDVDLAAAPRADVAAIANRGLAGIDGTLASAVGLALGVGRPTYALVGDLTFLHDLNGLLIGPAEPRPDLTVVVCNDDGGGIFATLEQGRADAPVGFERLFGTPTGADIAALATGVGARYLHADDADALGAALGAPDAITVVEVRTSRSARAAEAAALRTAVAEAL